MRRRLVQLGLVIGGSGALLLLTSQVAYAGICGSLRGCFFNKENAAITAAVALAIILAAVLIIAFFLPEAAVAEAAAAVVAAAAAAAAAQAFADAAAQANTVVAAQAAADAAAQANTVVAAQAARSAADAVQSAADEAADVAKEKRGSPPPSLSETIITDLTSQEVTAFVNITAIATTLIGTFTFVAKLWSKKRSASTQGIPLEPSESDIVAIRLRMTHGPDHEFEEWLTDPDRLKYYIDVFNQPSSSIQPLHAVFVQRNGKELRVDVTEGAQNNLQLNELLKYLKIDSTVI